MTNKRARLIWSVVGIAIVLGILGLIVCSQPFHDCVARQGAPTTQQNQSNNKTYPSIVLHGPRLFVRCSAVTVSAFDRLEIAVATVFLTIITGFLCWFNFRQIKTTRAELRAYVTAAIGTAVFQERDKRLKFEGKVSIVNAGNTPARNLRFTRMARIMSMPVSKTFAFPEGDWATGGALGPKQDRSISALVDGYCDDDKVEDIKIAKGQALVVWGKITYDDMFGEAHWTEFGQVYTWIGERIHGYYTDTHNDMD